MFVEIWKWLFANYPGVVIILAIAVLVFLATRFFMKWYHRFTSTEKECASLVPKFDALQKSVNNIERSVNGLIIYLKAKDKEMDTSVFRSQSPIRLTSLGERILTESGGKQFVDENLSHLFNEIEKEELKSALDVENSAVSAILFSTNMDAFTRVKDYVFNNPIYKGPNDERVNLQLATVVNIIGIYLRDIYLEKHPQFLQRGAK
jgi:hypothetical protein